MSSANQILERIKPAPGRIVVKVRNIPERSPSGIELLPQYGEHEKPTQGVVIATSDDDGEEFVKQDGEDEIQYYEPRYKKGDRVLFGKYSGVQLKLNNERVIVLKEDDVIATVNEIPNPDAIKVKD